MPTYDAVVLMGPPGAGKSHLGRALQAAGLCAYRELEPELMARFGMGAQFQANKAAALAFIEADVRAQIDEATLPVALETTGVSDEPMLRRLARSHRLLWVRLDAAAALCAERIAAREAGCNLSNDPQWGARFHAYWSSQVQPKWPFDLVVDATDAEAAVAAIAARIA